MTYKELQELNPDYIAYFNDDLGQTCKEKLSKFLSVQQNRVLIRLSFRFASDYYKRHDAWQEEWIKAEGLTQQEIDCLHNWGEPRNDEEVRLRQILKAKTRMYKELHPAPVRRYVSEEDFWEQKVPSPIVLYKDDEIRVYYESKYNSYITIQ